jgi:ketosteroid isomerase-like protein
MRPVHFLTFALAFAPIAPANANAADDPDATALAETERAFARLCVEKGVRASFLIYFADDAVGFEPGPIKAKEAMLARPAPATKPPFTLDWWPEIVKVSRSGDFGWSTGPSQRTPDPGAAIAPPAHSGHYFSIWKKGSDGTWKVALDIGLACPPESLAPRGGARLIRTGGVTQKNDAASDPATSLQDAITQAVVKSDAVAVLGRFTADARFYVDGEPLVSGAVSASESLAKLPVPSGYEPAGGEVAASGDLAMTYGRLEFVDPSGAPRSRWIVNVWQRDDPSGPWLVAGAAYDAPLPAK